MSPRDLFENDARVGNVPDDPTVQERASLQVGQAPGRRIEARQALPQSRHRDGDRHRAVCELVRLLGIGQEGWA